MRQVKQVDVMGLLINVSVFCWASHVGRLWYVIFALFIYCLVDGGEGGIVLFILSLLFVGVFSCPAILTATPGHILCLPIVTPQPAPPPPLCYF